MRENVVQFKELLPRRRMVRHYAAEPVSREAIERIVATVRRAPSAGYSQGQRLLVVTEPEGRETIIRALGDAGWTTSDDREPVARVRTRARPRLHARE